MRLPIRLRRVHLLQVDPMRRVNTPGVSAGKQLPLLIYRQNSMVGDVIAALVGHVHIYVAIARFFRFKRALQVAIPTSPCIHRATRFHVHRYTAHPRPISPCGGDGLFLYQILSTDNSTDNGSQPDAKDATEAAMRPAASRFSLYHPWIPSAQPVCTGSRSHTAAPTVHFPPHPVHTRCT